MAKKMFMNPFVLLSGDPGGATVIGGASGNDTPDDELKPMSFDTWFSYYNGFDYMDYTLDGVWDKADYDLWWAEMAEDDTRFTEELYNELNP